MQMLNQIDQLIKNLNALKPVLSENPSSNNKKFNDVLQASINSSSATHINSENAPDFAINKKIESDIPDWVNPAYNYDVKNPRKPNMLELTEAISRNNATNSFLSEQSDWQNNSRLLTELLYGVVGDKLDIRDWNSIMKAEDVLKEVREETNKMHNPIIDIDSYYDDNDQIVNQYAVIKNNSGEPLRTLTGNAKSIESALDNYGIKMDAIPVNLKDKVVIEGFDNTVFEVLKKRSEKIVSNHLSTQIETIDALAIKAQISKHYLQNQDNNL